MDDNEIRKLFKELRDYIAVAFIGTLAVNFVIYIALIVVIRSPR